MYAIIGAGIGGLLAAALLTKEGKKVVVLERTSKVGGRFANIYREGFILSTGALHLLPHGSKGPFASILKELGIGFEIIECDATRMWVNKKIHLAEKLSKLMPLKERLRMFKAMKSLQKNQYWGSYGDFIRENVKSELLLSYAESFCRFVFSTSAFKTPLWYTLCAFNDIERYGYPGVVKGGCGKISEALADFIVAHGGTILLRREVREIDVTEGVLSTNEEDLIAERIISDIGVKETLKILKQKELLEKHKEVQPCCGIKISFYSEKPLIGHSCILFTLDTERVGGVVELTHADRSLSPEGKHLLMAHQIYEGGNVKKEIEKGIEDLERIFPSFDPENVLATQVYPPSFPVNRAAPGFEVPTETESPRLFIVGDSCKDGIETEGIAKSVKNLVNQLI